MMALGSYAASPSSVSSPVQANQFPGININVSPNTSYNLSYMYLIVKSDSGLMSSSFDQNNWSISDRNNNSVTYTANLTLAVGGQASPITSFITQSTDALSQQKSTLNNTYKARVDIKIGKLSNDGGTLAVDNSSSMINYVGNSTISILISIHFSEKIPGTGIVYLIQALKGNSAVNTVKYNGFNGDFNYSGTEEVSGLVVNTHPNSPTFIHDALYWWDNNYTEDGVQRTLNSTTFSSQNADYVVFEYPFSNGVSSIVQDPYISVPGVNIFHNPITQEQISSAINYLIVHSEFLGAGISGGIILLGLSYGMYRKRKF